MQIAVSPEVALAAVQLVGVAIASWVGLKVAHRVDEASSALTDKITSSNKELAENIASAKMDLMRAQEQLRLDTERRHGENKEALAVHIMEDKGNFRGLGDEVKRVGAAVGELGKQLNERERERERRERG